MRRRFPAGASGKGPAVSVPCRVRWLCDDALPSARADLAGHAGLRIRGADDVALRSALEK